MVKEALSDEEKLAKRRAIGRAKAARFRAAHPEIIKATNDARRAANPDKENARAAAWRAANPDRARALGKRWQDENRDKVHLANAQWATRNREKVNAISRQWQAAHPEKGIELCHRRRARLMACDEHYTAAEIFALRQEKGDRCTRCGTTKSGRMTIDHIVALSNGGSNSISNIQFLCRPCNSAKGNRY
jgi:5-methylcytosine-specific restriction endonuclease McrA